MVSGNAWLDLIADRSVIKTPIDYMTVWLRDGKLIIFRGGPIREWWWNDLEDMWALTTVYSGYTLDDHVMVLNENKGQLHVFRISVEIDAKERASEIVSAYQKGPGRLAKNSARAYHGCRTCPTKRQCDIIDKTTPGGTDDWGPGYPYP